MAASWSSEMQQPKISTNASQMNSLSESDTPTPATAPIDHAFVFVICQQGFENMCKQEIGRLHADFRFAFSRPGLLTFKTPRFDRLPVLQSTFARTYGVSLATLRCDDQATWLSQLNEVMDTASLPPLSQVHIWDRKLQDVGRSPGAHDAFVESVEIEWARAQLTSRFEHINQICVANENILDVIRVDPASWLIGFHPGAQIQQRWPGGVPLIGRPADMISRAYLKTREALLWSRLPIGADSVVVELGAAPGGSAQCLLEQGCHVLAVDPAELDPRIAEHPHLHHIRRRSKEVRKADLRAADWLLADMNVAAKYTLDAAEDLVSSAKLNFKGMLLTFKLMERPDPDSIHEVRERVKSWGFPVVKTRQLAFNRSEYCLVASQDKTSAKYRKT